MARGWESKSVDEQQSAEHTPAERASKSADKIEAKAHDDHMKRKRQDLELKRERILSERTSSPHRRAALTAALEEIEAKLAEFGWSVHM